MQNKKLSIFEVALYTATFSQTHSVFLACQSIENFSIKNLVGSGYFSG